MQVFVKLQSDRSSALSSTGEDPVRDGPGTTPVPTRVESGQSRTVLYAARLLCAVIIVGSLHIGQGFFRPIALALLGSFLLAPFAARIERLGVPRYPSAVTVVLGFFFAAAMIATVAVNELGRLADETPKFKENLSHKYEGVVGAFQDARNRIERGLQLPIRAPRRGSSGSANARNELPLPPSHAESVGARGGLDGSGPVPIHDDASIAPSPTAILSYLGIAVIELAFIALVVMVLSVIFLVYREDARDRLLRLAGENQLILTTQVIRDVVGGVRRYLLLNLGVNLLFGAAFFLVLILLRVPSPFIWAGFAVIARFVPHLGVYLALLPPMLLSLAVGSGWTDPLLIVFGGVLLDAGMSNFVEPYVYGRGIGVSPIAVVFSALFWTYCWGPVGLLFATPMTVCFAVMGRYVRGMEAFSMIFAEDTGLPAVSKLYHRLVAGEKQSARRVIEDERSGADSSEVIDRLLIPTLMLAEADLKRHLISHENFVRVLEEIAECWRETEASDRGERDVSNDMSGDAEAKSVAVWPLHRDAERLTAQLLVAELSDAGCSSRMFTERTMMSDIIRSIEESTPEVLVVVGLPPIVPAEIRYIMLALEKAKLRLPVVLACLGDRNARVVRNLPLDAPVVNATTVHDVVDAVQALLGARLVNSANGLARVEEKVPPPVTPVTKIVLPAG